jgi:acyl-CoA dehydrogenase
MSDHGGFGAGFGAGPHQVAAARIAAEVAGPAAAAVDAEARFPHEAFAALKAARLLGAAIPRELGGLGCSLAEVSAICTALGRSCASTATIFAMHQIQVACLVRHGGAVPFFRDYLARAAAEQLLIASGTSEEGVGGDLRTSNAAVEAAGGRFRLTKKCSVLSYGEYADAILISARRNADAAPGDQVLALVRKSETTLEKTGVWDTLGMRGTCSPSFKVTAEAAEEQILPQPFGEIASMTMVPYSHIVWSSGWLGIASEAVAVARTMIRQDARKRPGTTPFGATRLVETMNQLTLMRANVHEAAREYERLCQSTDSAAELSSLGYSLRINGLKLASSTLVSQICLQCLSVVGVAAYSNRSKFSLGQKVRDSLGAPLMVANDRIIATNANLALVAKEELS